MSAVLRSSHGHIAFDTGSGFVSAEGTELDPDFGPVPFKVDVDEWRLRYPGESLDGEHDVLDFGYWYRTGKTKVAYEAPCESWRLEREEAIRKGTL